MASQIVIDYDHVKKGFLSDNAIGNAMHIISPQFGGIPFDEKYTKKCREIYYGWSIIKYCI